MEKSENQKKNQLIVDKKIIKKIYQLDLDSLSKFILLTIYIETKRLKRTEFSVAYLSQCCDLSKRGFAKLAQSLKAAGYLEIKHNFAYDGTQLANSYFVML